MTDTTDKRADATRQQILRAASHQFARRAYHDVGLDEILAEAELTKGAMYFHFRSKHALALAVIDRWATAGGTAIEDLLARKLSGLESLVDFSFQIAVQDISQDAARAALNLLGSVGPTEGMRARLFEGWIENLALVVRRGIAEGDIPAECDPQDVGRFAVSLYLGMRQTSDLDEPERYLLDFEKAWDLMLSGIAATDRADYFRQFIGRRTARAISTVSTRRDPD